MSKGLPLTEREKGRIDQLLCFKWTQRKIAVEVSRSKTAVQHYICSLNIPKQPSKSGRLMLLGPRTVKRIIKLASNKAISCRQIRDNLGLKVSIRTVLRVIVRSTHLKYAKRKQRPMLTQAHKEKRINFAIEHVRWCWEWHYIVFSDEKKFNLDGPDGYKFYWHDLQKGELTYSTRVQGGGSVMIWCAFSKRGKAKIQFITSTMDSQKYVDMLQVGLIPYVEEKFGDFYTFQQDNAPCHTSKLTKAWLEEKEIPVLEWPACSPDLNPIENLWGMLARKVYENGKQYMNVKDLKQAILKAWDEITEDYLWKLVDSMEARMKDVLVSRGNSIGY